LAVAHTEYGKFLSQANRPAEAEAELRKAVEVLPKDRNARFVLASYYLVTKQFDKAEESYKELASLEPDKPENAAVLADFYSAINRSDDAVRIYKDILSKSPDYLQGRYRLGEILLTKGDTQGANAQIDEIPAARSHEDPGRTGRRPEERHGRSEKRPQAGAKLPRRLVLHGAG
jgi:tetratricopeptide (TPR) repeat protein